MTCGMPSSAENTFVFLNWLYNKASACLRLGRIRAWPEMLRRQNMLDQRREMAPIGVIRLTLNGRVIRFGVRTQDELFGRV